LKLIFFLIIIPGGEYVNKTPLNRRNMASLLRGPVVVGPGSGVEPGVAGAAPSPEDCAVNEEFEEDDFNMEALDTDDTLTIGEIAASKAAKIAEKAAEKDEDEDPFEDVDGGSVLVGPGSGVAGAALSTTDWHQAEKDAEIAEKDVEVTYTHSQTMSVKCQKQQEPKGLVVSPQEPQVSTNGFTFNNCNNITFVMKK
jgi:hypothetical protein